MTPHEFDPDAHERLVRDLHDDQKARLGKFALFEEVMVYVDAGMCTFEEAIAQYKHDLEVGDVQG